MVQTGKEISDASTKHKGLSVASVALLLQPGPAQRKVERSRVKGRNGNMQWGLLYSSFQYWTSHFPLQSSPLEVRSMRWRE